MLHKIGIYVRVSTEEQAQVADGSIDSQQHRIRGFIDMKLSQDRTWGKVIDTYIDDGFSAKSTNRPAYQRMIRDLKLGKINLILITDLSRLSRNISDFCDLYKELGKFKAHFLSIKEQFDTSTPVGEMMVFNMVNLAQFERKQTSERISMNFHSRALRGLKNGGAPLLGYDSDPTNAGKRIVNKDEAKLVQEIFSMYNEGKNVAAIADYLNKEGFKRKQTGSVQFRHIKDNRWTHKTIVAMLKNCTYIAKREVNSKNKNEVQAHLKAWQQYQIVPASWPAIIDEALFYKVQKRLETTRLVERTRVDNGESRVFFISGLIKCECCGRALVGHSAHGKSKVHRYYEHKRVKGEKISCPVTRYPANEIEDAILKHLDNVLKDSGYLDQVESNIKECMGLSKAADKSKKAVIEKSIQKIEVEIENVFKLTMTMKSGSAGSDLIHEKLQKLAEKKKAMEMELNEITNAQINASQLKTAKETILTNVLNLKKAMKTAKPHFQKRLFGLTFQQFVATKDGLKVFYSLVENMKTDGNDLKNKKPSELDSEGFLKSSINKWAKSPFFLSARVRTMGNMVGVEGIEPPTSTL
jgi:site-specific DNA recombinase